MIAPNILTLSEGLAALNYDIDYDDKVKDELPSIDRQIEVATGVKWQEDAEIDPLAKAAAKLMLIDTFAELKTVIMRERITHVIKQLQMIAMMRGG